MKVELNTVPGLLQPGQKVQGEVVGSGEGGSQIVVNGVPAGTEKSLPVGQRIEGTIEQTAGGGLTLNLSSLGDKAAISENWLSQNGLPVDSTNQGILNAFQSWRFPITPELIDQARQLFQSLGLEETSENFKNLALLVMRRLPASAFALLKKYAAGGLRLGQALALLAGEDGKVLEQWSLGKLWEKLSHFLQGKETSEFRPESREGFSKEILQNLVLQESMSAASKPEQEGHFYFQWPIFWKDSETPDTLEGEAFFAHNDRQEPGFSLRLLVNPPNLGSLEIGLHRVGQAVWVHFGSRSKDSIEQVRSMFPQLSEALEKLGWKRVKLTTGKMSVRDHFLAPAEFELTSGNEKKLDIRV